MPIKSNPKSDRRGRSEESTRASSILRGEETPEKPRIMNLLLSMFNLKMEKTKPILLMLRRDKEKRFLTNLLKNTSSSKNDSF